MTSRSASRPVSCHSRSSASNSRARSPVGEARSGGVDLDVVQADDRVDRERRGRRGPCARPGGGPGSRAGRRSSDVAADRGRARQPPVVRPGPSRLGTSPRASANGDRWPALGRDAVLRETRRGPASPGSGRRSRARRRPSRCRRRARGRRRGRSSRSANRPRRPDGVKMTSASSATGGRLVASRPATARRLTAAAADLALAAPGIAVRRVIQRAQSGSLPISTSAAMTQAFDLGHASGW